MPTPDLDQETRRIRTLIGDLSDAFWHRLAECQHQPGFSPLEEIVRNDQGYQAVSAEEVTIWDELTAPHNHTALARYVELRGGHVSDYSAMLYAAMLEASRRRCEGRA